MRCSVVVLVSLAVMAPLAGCERNDWNAENLRGRYAGVGVYTPGEPWARQSAPAPASPAAAKLADDEAVIVVIDSRSGEVRACGDLSGHCVRMNPWIAARATPVDLAPRAGISADAAVPPKNGR
jgi:hypothetical protein